MKKAWSNGIVMVMAALIVSVFTISTSKAQGSVSLQVFYDELQPYGTWMQHGGYGYVWIPRVDRSFTPYGTNGYWINTEYGNTWVSDYSWGWAPFHYGRWFYDDFYGWLWLPDTEWGPAWVAWRSGGGYYGWAPLMPGFAIGVSFNYYNRIPHRYWNFVPCRYITYRTVYHHCVSRPQVINIINNTTIVTNHYTDNRRRTFFTGPSRSEMERTGRERVDVYKINDRNRPGRSDIERGTVSFYKPEIDNSRDARTRTMPSRFMQDNGSGKMEQAELRRERSSEFLGDRKIDNVRHSQLERQDVKREDEGREFNQPQRSPLLESEREMDAFQRFERENTRRDENDFNQRRTQQVERQNTIRQDQNFQQEHENVKRNDQQRTYVQPQRSYQVERQNANRLNQPNQNFERQRSTVTPNNNWSSTLQPQREQQIRRGSSDFRSKQPVRSGESKESSPRKRN